MSPPWITKAQAYLGVREVPGAGNSPVIIGWLIKLRAWWRDDLTPWCGTFVATCLTEAGMLPPKAWYRAKSYLAWGTVLTAPYYGCVVVFDRTGGGHVGFVVGKDQRGRLLVLGGNQGDKVGIAPFEMSRVAGYRWPLGVPLSSRELPVITENEGSSKNEA